MLLIARTTFESNRHAYLSVRQLVALLERRAGSGGGHLLLEVQRHVAQLLLDVANDFTLGRRHETVAALRQDLHQVVGEIAAGKVETQDGVRQSVALVDGHRVGDAVARVEHNTGRTTGGVQRQDGLDGDVHRRRVERLEHDLSHHNHAFHSFNNGRLFSSVFDVTRFPFHSYQVSYHQDSGNWSNK